MGRGGRFGKYGEYKRLERLRQKRQSTLPSKVKLSAHKGGASRARSGEQKQNVSQGNLIYIVPLDPAYKAGLAGHLPVTRKFLKRKPSNNKTR